VAHAPQKGEHYHIDDGQDAINNIYACGLIEEINIEPEQDMQVRGAAPRGCIIGCARAVCVGVGAAVRRAMAETLCGRAGRWQTPGHGCAHSRATNPTP
jgi:hypothetical protein